VSTREQNPASQYDALTEADITPEQIIIEKISGQLRVLLLLGRLAPRPSRTARDGGTADGTRKRREGAARRLTAAGAILAAGARRDTRLAFPLDRAATLVAGMVGQAPASAAASPDELGRGRLRPAPLHPELTNYR
jgi:hypothetical protein